MNDQQSSIEHIQKGAEAGASLLSYVQRFNWIMLAVLTAGSWYLFSRTVAQSVLVGGLLANGSFFMLRRDVSRFIGNFSKAGMNWQAVKKLEKIKFFLNLENGLMHQVSRKEKNI